MSTKSHELTGYTHPSLGETGLTLKPQAFSARVEGNVIVFTADRNIPLDFSDIQQENAVKILFSRPLGPDNKTPIEPFEQYQALQKAQGILSAPEQSALKTIRERTGIQYTPPSQRQLALPSVLPDEVAPYVDVIKQSRARKYELALRKVELATQIRNEQEKLNAAAQKHSGRRGNGKNITLATAASFAGLTPVVSQAIVPFEQTSPTVQEFSFTSQEWSFITGVFEKYGVLTQFDQTEPRPTPTLESGTTATATATAEAKNPDFNVRTGPSTGASSVGRVAEVFGRDNTITISGYIENGGYLWYFVAEKGWIRNDGLSILPDPSGQVPQLPNLQRAYEIASQMKQYGSEDSALQEISNLVTLNTLIDLLDFNGFPEGTAESLSLLGSKSTDDSQTDIFIQTRDLEENPEKSLFIVKKTQEGLTPVFIPYTGADGVQEILKGLGQPTNVDFRFISGNIQLVNNETGRVFGYINVEHYLETFDLQKSMVFGEVMTRAEVNPDDKQGFIEANSMLGQILDAIEHSDPVFIHENVIDSVGNGYLGDITVNGIDHALMAGTVIFHHRLVNEVNTIVYIVVGVPDVNGGTSYFQMDIPYSDSFFGPRPMLFVENYEGLQNASPEGTTPEAIGAQLGQYRNYTEFVQNVLEPLRVGDIVVLTMPRNDKLTPFIEGVQLGTDFSHQDTFEPRTERAEKFLRNVWPKSADDQHALIMPGTMSVTDLDETPLFIALSPLSSP